jgi:hypothetical protein
MLIASSFEPAPGPFGASSASPVQRAYAVCLPTAVGPPYAALQGPPRSAFPVLPAFAANEVVVALADPAR